MLKLWKIVRIPLFLVAFVAVIAFTLTHNKEKAKETAKIAEKTVDTYPVSLVGASIENFEGNFNLTGNLEPNRELNFASETAGRTIAVYFEKGSFVSEGQMLVKLDDETIQRELKIANITLEKRKKDFERVENLAKSSVGTMAQYDDTKYALQTAEQQVEALKERLAKTIIKSPISGVVSRKAIEKGSYLAPNVPIADITDISRLKMIIKVSESELMKIQQGQAVKIKIDAYPEADFSGVVTNLAVKADNSKRYEVEIQVNNSTGASLRGGLFGVVYFQFAKSGSALMIPRKAIVGSIQDAQVFVVENGVAFARKVKVGTVKNDKIEVVEGLKDGEKVVVTGQINLQDKTKVTEIK